MLQILFILSKHFFAKYADFVGYCRYKSTLTIRFKIQEAEINLKKLKFPVREILC